MQQLLANHPIKDTDILEKKDGVSYTIIRKISINEYDENYAHYFGGRSIHAELLSFFKIMLTQYDEIKQKNQKNRRRMIFSERINKL